MSGGDVLQHVLALIGDAAGPVALLGMLAKVYYDYQGQRNQTMQAKPQAKKTAAEAEKIYADIYESLLETLREEIAKKENEKTMKVNELEKKVADMAHELEQFRKKNRVLIHRQGELERGIGILIEQIRSLGQVPKYTMEELEKRYGRLTED